MRPSKVILVFVAGIFFSCNKENKSVETPKQITMDSATHIEHAEQIKGPAGMLFFEDGGTGGIPVIFLHSFAGSIGHWQTQLEHLRDHRRAIAFDFRGHGKSDAPSDNNYSTEALSEDLKTIIDSLDLDRFILVGHSMGGSAAIAYAATEPERVAGLMLVGTPGKTPAEQSKPIISSLRSEKYQQVMDNYMDRLLKDARPDVKTKVIEDYKKISREPSIALIQALFDYNPLPDMQRYPGPKLIVATSAEEQQPNTLIKQLGDVPYRTVSGTSHWMHMDRPEEFNNILDEFLKKVESR
jgi:pimeloyl-ACP methyl ester carboxylesterase